MASTNRAEQMRRLLERRDREHLTFLETAALDPGVSINQLFWWRRKLFGGRAAAVQSTPAAEPFVELVALRSPANSRIEIVVAGERHIVVNGDVDESLLVRVVRALERGPHERSVESAQTPQALPAAPARDAHDLRDTGGSTSVLVRPRTVGDRRGAHQAARTP